MIMDGNFYIGTCAIDLTYKCTFRCLHCFNSSGEHSLNKQELSDAEILQFIDDINNYSVGLISIGGGEALLRKELILQISDYLSGNNSKIDLGLYIACIEQDVTINLQVIADIKNLGVFYVL